jgi:TPP-dependent pyruvate/acetoin dehydrogenase alpha subunit
MARRDPFLLATIGDGSLHNHHFWSAFYLARHARHREIKCPAVFGISDNGLTISNSTGGNINTLFNDDPLVPVVRVHGNDMMDVYSKTQHVFDYARRQSAPAVVVYQNLVRRIGHAATYQQNAYLKGEQIKSMAEMQIMECALVQAEEVLSATTYITLLDKFQENAFAITVEEAKVTRDDMVQRVSAPLHPMSSISSILSPSNQTPNDMDAKPEVMRKH